MVKLKCECDYCMCVAEVDEYDSRTTDEQLDACYEKLKPLCEETLNRLQGASIKAKPSSPLVWNHDRRNLISDKVKVEQHDGGIDIYGDV